MGEQMCINKKAECKKHIGEPRIKIKNSKGTFCKQCIEENWQIKEKNFIEKCKKVHNNKFDYTKTIYSGVKDKILIICKKHGEFLQWACNHVRGQGCDKCLNDSLRRTTVDIIKKSNLIHRNIYDYSKMNYINDKTPVIIICKKHGEFYQKLSKHFNGQGCPKCKMSHGERSVGDFLIDNNISFVFQKMFNNCCGKNGNKLKFDFYLPTYNILIEFDGEQHFKKRYFGGANQIRSSSNLKRTQELDGIKNKYVRKHKIFLIRIGYKKLKNIDKLFPIILEYINLKIKKRYIKYYY